MKRTLWIIVFLAAVTAWAGLQHHLTIRNLTVVAFNWTAPPPGPTYLFTESFEGTGYENAGWSEEVGTWNEDDTTQAADLAQSVSSDGGDRLSCNDAWTATGGTTYGFFAMWIESDGFSDEDTIRFRNSSEVEIMKFQVQSDGDVRCYHGTGIYGQANGVWTFDAWQYVWWEYTPESGGGGNGTLNVYISDTTTKPGAADIELTTGVGANDPVGIYIRHDATCNLYVDQIIIDDEPIGSLTPPPADPEFDISGATYYAVAEAGYTYSTEQTAQYSTRKYNTLAAAEAALPATPTTPLVINILGTWAAADTTAFTLNASTSTANYLVIRAIGDARHAGAWTDTAYRMAVGASNGITIATSKVKFDGIQFQHTPGNDWSTRSTIFGGSNTTTEVNASLFLMDTSAGSGARVAAFNQANWGSGGTITLTNCAFIRTAGTSTASGILEYESTGTMRVYNCLFSNLTTGIRRDSTMAMHVANCGFVNCADDIIGTPTTELTNSSVNPALAADGIHLSPASSIWMGAGTDLSATFTTDIDGETRAHWDIGADEYTRPDPAVFTHYVALDGSTDYISTPDSAINDPVGEFDIRVKIAADDWTPTASQTYFGRKGFGLHLTSGGGINLYLSPDYSNWYGASTASMGWTDGAAHWIRATRNGTAVNLYTSADEGETWTAETVTSNTIPVSDAYNFSDPIYLGAFPGTTPEEDFAGKIFYAELRDGIDGTVVARFNASEVNADGTAFANVDGQTAWTNNGGTYVNAVWPVVDTFTVASNTPLESHTGDTGAGWSLMETDDFTVEAATGAVYAEISDTRSAISEATMTGPDYLVEATGTLSTTASGRIGVFARWVDDNNKYYFYAAQSGSTFLYQKTTAGGWSLIDSGSITGFVNTAEYIIAIEVIGDSVKGYINGVENCAATGTGPTTAAKAGLSMAYTGARVTRFQVTER